ncbi:MAG: FAD-binding protein [Jatrophihabitans sp.]
MAPLTNWAGSITFGTELLHRPSSVAQLQSLVASSDRARVLGTGHSFNRIADTTGALISVGELPQLLELDSASSQVRVSAGTRYGELTAFLDQHSLALANLGSLPHISVAGACATGTHGSGDRNSILAAAVRGQRLVAGDGQLIELDPSTPDFAGTVVGLGSLGVVTELVLQAVPAFEIRQYVYDDLALDALEQHFDEISAAAYSVSVFTRYGGDQVDGVWLKSLEERSGDFFGAAPAGGQRHPVPGEDGSTATQQGGVPGRWQHRLPHFRLEFTPSSGAEIQSEYFVDRDQAVPAIRAVRSMADQLAPVLMVGEIRTIAADELWLSPCLQRDRVALHFTWIRDEAAVRPVVAELEARLADFAAVPHWGKYFLLAPERLAELHPRLADFAALVRHYDPSATFTNDFVRRYVGAG